LKFAVNKDYNAFTKFFSISIQISIFAPLEIFFDAVFKFKSIKSNFYASPIFWEFAFRFFRLI